MQYVWLSSAFLLPWALLYAIRPTFRREMNFPCSWKGGMRCGDT